MSPYASPAESDGPQSTADPGHLSSPGRAATSVPEPARVEGLNVDIEEEAIRIGIRCPEEPAVEIWEAAKHEDLFRRAFGHDLSLYWAQEP